MWRSHEPPGEIGFKIHGAWGPTIDDLWIVGQDQGDGVVERLDGCNIEPDCVEEILRLPAQGLFGVHGFASGEAYAAGVTVLEKSPTDVWTPLPTPAGMPLLRAVWGPSPTEVFFAGHDGTVMFYDGSSFSFLTSRRPELGAPEEISDDALKAIWGTSSSEVWVGGQAGRVWHFDGASWTAVDTGAFGDIVSIAGTGSNDIFALSDSSLAHFDGATWTPVRLPSSEASYFALAVHPSRVYVVGARGAVVGIVRTEPWSP